MLLETFGKYQSYGSTYLSILCYLLKVKNARGLRRVTLQNIRMTDADISDLLTSNSFARLEELNISANGPINLTEDSVFKLINLCPRFDEI